MARPWRSVVLNEYDPLIAGSIDGTDTRPHDRAVCRALGCKHIPPVTIESKPECCVFLARLPLDIADDEIREKLEQVAAVSSVTVVRDVVTGMGKGYAFVELKREKDVERVLRECVGITFGGKEALLDREVGRTLKGWVPRRLGGGWGGRKESGQLRFGCRDRPWKCPLAEQLSQKKNVVPDRKGQSNSSTTSQNWDASPRMTSDIGNNSSYRSKSRDSSRKFNSDVSKNSNSGSHKSDPSRRRDRNDNDDSSRKRAKRS